MPKTRPIWTVALAALLLMACSTMKHFRTTRTVTLDNAPYYNGKVTLTADAKVGHLPVALNDSQNDLWDSAPWQEIVTDVNAWLNKQDWSMAMAEIGLKPQEWPEIEMGDRNSLDMPPSASDDEEEDNRMVLHYIDPSYKWRDQVRAQCKAQGLTHVLAIYIGRGQYKIRQKDWKGSKELVLGTGYHVPVKWLTSLDDPIEVIHFTGAVMDSSGHILRAGAEGILAAKSASVLESAIGLQNSVSDKKMQKLTTGVLRKDLPGQPLAYQVALQNLVGQLLKKKAMLVK